MSFLSPSELAYQEAHIHEDKAPTLITSVAILVSLSSVIITCRIVTRIITKVGLGVDDFIIFIAWILTWGGFVAAYYDTLNGLGKHLIAVKPEEFIGIVKIAQFSGPNFFVTVALTQISVLFLYKRVFTTMQHWFRMTLYVLGTLSILTGFTVTVAILSKCTPFSYDWTRYSLDSGGSFSNKKGHCTDGIGYLYPAHAIVTLLIDVAIVLVPLPIIWRLQMSAGTKRAIAGMFLLGIFVAIMNLIRLPQLFNVNDRDYTYTDIEAVIWTQAELNLGVVSACLPILKPLARRCKELVTTNRSTASGSTSQPRTKPTTDAYKTLSGKESSAKSRSTVVEEIGPRPDLELGDFPKVISVTRDIEVSSSEEKMEG